MDSLGVLSATVGVTLLHHLPIFIIDGLYSVIWYVDIMQQLCIPKDFNLYHDPSIMTKVNVSATVGKLNMLEEI